MLNQNIMDSKIFSFLFMAIFVILFVTISIANAETDKCNTKFSTKCCGYYYCPVLIGQIQFRVKAARDAHIVLTTDSDDTDGLKNTMYEIIIGWENIQSVVRKTSIKPNVAEEKTPGILSENEYRGFWIRWNDGVFEVGKNGTSSPFLSYTDPEPLPIGYYGVSTGNEASGDWLIEGDNHLKTPKNLRYKLYPIQRGSVLIDIKGKRYVYINLSIKKNGDDYRIALAKPGHHSEVSYIIQGLFNKVRVYKRNLLNKHEFKRFSITWYNGVITVRLGDRNGTIFMQLKSSTPTVVTYVGVSSSWSGITSWQLHFENY